MKRAIKSLECGDKSPLWNWVTCHPVPKRGHVRALQIRSVREYRRLVSFLDRLGDEVGEQEGHPLASLMDVIGVLIEKYEDEHVAELA